MFVQNEADQQPFSWLQGLLSLLSLLVTTSVLITQKHQEKITEQRRHLDLQVNLLVEKKVMKLIDMIDDLRKDLPNIENKQDPQVEAMKEPVDPHTVLKSLNETMQNATSAQQ